jgi:hypothetical protein
MGLVQAAAFTSFSFAPVPERPISSTASMIRVSTSTPARSSSAAIARRGRFAQHQPDQELGRPRTDLELPNRRDAEERRAQLNRVHADPTAVAGRQAQDIFAPPLDRRRAQVRPPAWVGPYRCLERRSLHRYEPVDLSFSADLPVGPGGLVTDYPRHVRTGRHRLIADGCRGWPHLIVGDEAVRAHLCAVAGADDPCRRPWVYAQI